MVSFLPPGSITVLNYGYLVISAVGGTVFFRSVIVALVPRLTDAHNLGGQAEVRRFTGLGMRIMLAISLPLTAFMAVLARPAAIAVFERGSFKLASAELLGTVLAVYAVSLVGSGSAARAARAVLRAARHANSAAERVLRGARQPRAAADLRAAVRPAQSDGDRRRRPRVLACPVRQRRARLVSPLPRRTATRSGPVSVHVEARWSRPALSAAVMIAGRLVRARPRTGSTDRAHLLLFTPVSAIVGLAVLAGAVMLLNGGLAAAN